MMLVVSNMYSQLLSRVGKNPPATSVGYKLPCIYNFQGKHWEFFGKILKKGVVVGCGQLNSCPIKTGLPEAVKIRGN